MAHKTVKEKTSPLYSSGYLVEWAKLHWRSRSCETPDLCRITRDTTKPFPVSKLHLSLLLDVVFSALDITSGTKNALNDILDELRSSKPIFLLFDDFETPWNASGARGEVAQFLRDLDAIPHVALFITMRETITPCDDINWTEMQIEPLNSCRFPPTLHRN
ncbi:hypothetical protein C8J56DRAFT_1047771 [Mycena floridula]|nr:hypothetical protein C8J56DRAFT_1047771 [Mycena floridula]